MQERNQRATKAELEEDEFLEWILRAIEYLKERSQLFIGGAVAIVAVIAIASFMQTQRAEARERAATLLFEATIADRSGQVDQVIRIGQQLVDDLAGTPAAAQGMILLGNRYFALGQGVAVQFDGGTAVFQLVLLSGNRTRQLARLAHRQKAGSQSQGNGGSQDEAPCLDTGDEVYIFRHPRCGQGVDRALQTGGILQQWSDVAEHDSRLREIGHVTYECAQVVAVGHGWFRSPLVTNVEVVIFTRRWYWCACLTREHAAHGRSVMHVADEFVKRCCGAFGDGLYRTIWQVPDVSRQAECEGPFSREPAEADPLNTAVHTHMNLCPLLPLLAVIHLQDRA